MRVPHHLDNRLKDGGKVVSLTCRPHITLHNHLHNKDCSEICQVRISSDYRHTRYIFIRINISALYTVVMKSTIEIHIFSLHLFAVTSKANEGIHIPNISVVLGSVKDWVCGFVSV